uniref:Putative cytochrome P450, Ribonuclease H-like domain, GAG-pre-integrase domain protein n=1 Tax=Helianthus annuus TaxID=4232 RepID=A0A251U2J3_HELAN
METMEKVAITIVVVVMVSWGWKLLNWVWLKPKRLEKWLRDEGYNGNSYRLLIGDMIELATMMKEGKSKPIPVTHDITSYALPFDHHIFSKYGEKSFVWLGPKPTMYIKDPELIKHVLLRPDEFQKPYPEPVQDSLIGGLLVTEGHKWIKHRKIINPAFNLQNLKIMFSAISSSCSDMIHKWELIMAEAGSIEVNVWPYIDSLAGDVISRTAFGTYYKEAEKKFEIQKEQTDLIFQMPFILHPSPSFLPLPSLLLRLSSPLFSSHTMDTKLHPASTVNNIKSLIPVTLEMDSGLYASWSELFRLHCRAFQVIQHLSPKPTAESSSSKEPDKEKDKSTQPVDDSWDRLDAIVLQWIYATISSDLLHTILKPNATAHEAWVALENIFHDNKSSRAIHLRHKFSNTRLSGFPNVSAYCQQLKVLSDQLASVGAPVDNQSLVLQLISGLKEQYEGIATILQNQDPLPSFYSMMLVLNLSWWNLVKLSKPFKHLKPPVPHSTPTLLDQLAIPTDRVTTAPTATMVVAAVDETPVAEDVAETRVAGVVTTATVHGQTGTLGQTHGLHSGPPLLLGPPSSGPHLPSSRGPVRHRINSGPPLLVHTRHSTPLLAVHPLLKEFLDLGPLRPIMPHIRLRILNKQFEFDPFGFLVKDYKTRIPILRCNSSGDLYPLLLGPGSTTNPSTFAAISSQLWHHRLGHPGQPIMQSLKRSCSINFSTLNNNICQSCVFGKSVRLPFVTSHTNIFQPFDIIHSDLWTSPILSSGGHRYYLLFLDDHTNFLWTYPISQKSQVYSIFCHFYKYINTQFEKKIKTLQCDRQR